MIFICLVNLGFIQAQDLTPQINQDTISQTHKDNLKKIEAAAKKSGKLTRELHRLIFRPIQRKQSAAPIKIEKNFKKYEGKVIRKIKIETLDPFGFSIDDTLQQPSGWLDRFGNSLHSKTNKSTVRNLLLFKDNDLFDSLIVNESERLVRSQNYIRRVKLVPILVGKDSVDIEIRVLDSWSLIPQGSASSSRINLELTERNFFGTGHSLQNKYRQNLKNSDNAYSFKYTIPNIQNTYINSSITYDKDLDNNTIKRLEIERPFFSPLTKWAAGFNIDEVLRYDSLPNPQDELIGTLYKSKNQSAWLGRSFILPSNSEVDRTQRLVTTVGFYNTSYSKLPSLDLDPYRYFSNSQTYLTSIGINSRQYVEDRYVFEYDRTEDVAIGRVIALTTGIQVKNVINRPYLGLRYAFANYYNFGYLSANLEAGSFFNKKELDQSMIHAEIIYFSRLKPLGSWNFRYFIKPEITLGFNRIDFEEDRITLDGNRGISGFNDELLGKKRATLALQLQSYAPGIWYGFRFSPFINYTCGLLEENNLFKSQLYSKIGIGLLISNDFLVFNQFQISFAYYPRIPFDGDNIMRTNSFKNSDFALPDFSIENPDILEYD